MRAATMIMALGGAILVGLFATACLPECPEPEPIEDRLQPIVYQTYIEDARPDRAGRGHHSYRGLHPSQSEMTLEVISEDQIRITYEQEGKQVVEVYAVSERRIH